MAFNTRPLRTVHLTFIAALAASAGTAVAGPGFTFTPLGQSTGQNFGIALSSDGTRIAGEYPDATQFYWSSATGFVAVPSLPGGSNNSAPAAVSNTGAVVGFSNGANGTEAYRWTAVDGTLGLGNFASNIAFFSEATGISDNGQLICGTGLDNVGNRSFLYNGVLNSLGSFPGTTFDGNYAHGMSGDGSIIVGEGVNSTNHSEGYVWTQATGIVGIGSIGVDNTTTSVISPNGQVMGGRAWNDADQFESSWVRIAGTTYMISSPDADVILNDVSNTGVAVGLLNTQPVPTGLVWTASSGMVLLNTYFEGVPGTDGWNFADGAGISADGNTILVSAVNTNGEFEAALFTKQATCYANCDGSSVAPILNVGDFTCFLQKYAAGDPYANCDGSTVAPVLNVGDFTCFLQKYAAGCP